MMALAGHRARAITYMVGNNVIAETMYRHDPGVMLYAPLRTVIYEDTDGAVHVGIDQPSKQIRQLRRSAHHRGRRAAGLEARGIASPARRAGSR